MDDLSRKNQAGGPEALSLGLLFKLAVISLS